MSQSDVGELYGILRKQSEQIAALTVTVARIEERMKAAPADIPARVAALEMDRARIQGAGWAAKVVWAVIGAGGVGLLVKVGSLLAAVR